MNVRRMASARHLMAVTVALVALVASACTAASPQSVSSFGDTLRLAFGASMTSPNPALFYENEGLNVMQATYEGLVQYNANTPSSPAHFGAKIEPALARGFSVSPDGLTYSFKLREGVTFHDGTPLDSTAAKESFEWFSKVKGGPSYMLDGVTSYETPDASTFVIKLKEPFEPFLSLLASPYGPRLISPTAIKKNAAGDDLAKGWLRTHDAGTGPYTISSWTTSEYKLTAYPKYWGTAPAFKNVDIKIVPSFATQQVQLRQGNLDLIVNGVLPGDIKGLKAAGVEVWTLANPVLELMYMNPGKGPFADRALRKAVSAAIDRKMLVTSGFGDTGTVARTFAPKDELPADVQSLPETAGSKDELAKAVAALPAGDRKVKITYATQDTVSQQLADLTTSALTGAGLDVTATGIPLEQIFTWTSTPASRSDILFLQSNGDSANAYTWYSLFYSASGALAFMGSKENGCTAADARVEQAAKSISSEEASRGYAEADALYANCALVLPIADTQGVVAYRAGLTGLAHPFASQTTVKLAELKPKGR